MSTNTSRGTRHRFADPSQSEELDSVAFVSPKRAATKRFSLGKSLALAAVGVCVVAVSFAVCRPSRVDAVASTDPQIQVNEIFTDRSDDSIDRSGLRNEVHAAVCDQQIKDRDQIIAEGNYEAELQEAQFKAEFRDEILESELVEVRAKSDEIVKEKEAAAKALLQHASSTTDRDLTHDEVSALLDEGFSSPMVLGTYSLNALFGATGSWSNYHTGVDFVAPVGTPVYAVTGSVVGTPTNGSWAGNNVILHQVDGSSVLYAHLDSSVVRPGEIVKAGQLIGYVGNTGRSYGSHLHFEYYPPGATPGDVYTATDPLPYLAKHGIKP